MSSEHIPSIGEALAPLLQRIPAPHQPLLIAAAERMAAARYRDWATRVMSDPARATQLLACAEREEEIAGRVESLFPDASTIQRDLVASVPEMPEINRSLFADRPLVVQFTIQANGERLGAATWRAFARHAPPAARETFLACAELEERSAEVLEAILRAEREH